VTRLTQRARFCCAFLPETESCTRFMKRWQIILIIVFVALFCGCVGVLLGFAIGEQIGQRAGNTAPPSAPTDSLLYVECVVAAQPIEQASLIDPGMLSTIYLPEGDVTAEMFFAYEDVIGGYARYDIPRGALITRRMVYFTAP